MDRAGCRLSMLVHLPRGCGAASFGGSMKPSSDRKSQERDGPWCHIGMVVEGFADFGLIYAVLEVWHFTVQRHFTVWGWDQLGISWSWNLGSLCMLSCPSRWSFPLISGLTSVILLTEKLGRRSARAGVVIVKLWCMLALTAAGYHLASITAFFAALDFERGRTVSLAVTIGIISVLLTIMVLSGVKAYRRYR